MSYTMEQLEKEIEREYNHWDKLYHHGSYDPFYADGMGLNLTRNHIIYYKRQMEELIGTESTTLFGSELPEIYYKEIPPKVDYNYMAQPEAIRERAKEQIALYEQDENFQYLINIKNTVFPNNRETKEIKEAHLPFYPVLRLEHYKKSYEEDDLVAMRRDFYVDYEKKKDDWERYVGEIKSFLTKARSKNNICPVGDVKEPLEAKIERLTASDTTSQLKHSKQQASKKELFYEEQLSLF